jgi:8-amino-7-oxononanoate synthase
MSNPLWEARLGEQLRHLEEAGLRRALRETSSAQGPRVHVEDREQINFSSNDYLGLANHEALIESAARAARDHGWGAGASRLISGHHKLHKELEETLAGFKGTEAALTFSTGMAVPLGILPALAGREDFILLDKLSHACLIDGARLSGATMRIFPHNHLGILEKHLRWARSQSPEADIFIVTESVFSMDGDVCPLREIVELKERWGAILLLDEAHATGVLGPDGRGLAAEQNLNEEIDLHMGTLGKAAGASGGYIAASRTVVDTLLQRSRTFVFSTAPPLPAAAAATTGLQLLSSHEGETRRKSLHENLAFLKRFLPGTAHLPAAILPHRIGSESRAVEISAQLWERGFWIPAIRYPTVPRGAARLRISATAGHERSELEKLEKIWRDPDLGLGVTDTKFSSLQS